jgi:hypothetical protein
MEVKPLPAISDPPSQVPPPNTSRFEFAGATVPLSSRLVGLPLVLYPAETLSSGYIVSAPLYSATTTPAKVMLGVVVHAGLPVGGGPGLYGQLYVTVIWSPPELALIFLA